MNINLDDLTFEDVFNDLNGVQPSKWMDIIDGSLVEQLVHEYEKNNLTKESVWQFTSELKKVFSTELYFRLHSVETIKSINKDEKEVSLLRVVATVINPKGDGSYEAFPHPIKRFEQWEVSAVIPKKKFKKPLIVGNIFSAKYKAQFDPRHLTNLISFELSTYRDIKMDFQEMLQQIGGDPLVQSAQAAFGTEIEQAIVGEFLNFSQAFKVELENEQKELTKNRLLLEKQTKKFEDRWNHLEEEEAKWLRLLERAREIFQTEAADESLTDSDKNILEWDNTQLISSLQSMIYHNSDDNLVYEQSVIEAFARAIQSNILVILTGPSGTGKSSLVQAFAHAIKGAKAKFIPVQSSWTDTQDLLGYFNPVDKRFVASPFLEALADARDDHENLHLICLDEMNLAHVEYYFSEFLSVRELKKPAIRLYSNRYYTDARLLVEHMDETSEMMSMQELEKYRNALELVTRYPAMFEIPENVRFVGTLNMDHTVKPLSPKVIDRSVIIELNHSERSQEIENRLLQEIKSGCIDVSLQQFSAPVKTEEDVESAVNEIWGLAKKLDSIPNARLNSRGKKQLTELLTRMDAIQLEHKDQLIYSKILPRINVSKREEKDSKTLEGFGAMLAPYPNSYKKFQKMNSGTRMVHFW